ncbi:Coenzyme PQQ synthesis protein D (PqqD) [Halorientalis persicus]|uniref:Coenzyme PQQ synthesis protein D (PqqD) n=1 Tax=Halorientalis persicus TaxID=1367881 RepID=A0A1H8W070_9EURY|nr:PqqD family protein [Halorientalis persicus]SEP21062.1 Coenzyme PQQ synthesis protein D (PqqD) [Halorientalis persicus]
MGGTTEFTDSTEVVAVDNCLSTTLDGESVILHTGAGKYYGFNEVGTDVWESLQQPTTVQDITNHLVEEYEVSYNRCSEDVKELLSTLLDKDLIQIVEK